MFSSVYGKTFFFCICFASYLILRPQYLWMSRTKPNGRLSWFLYHGNKFRRGFRISLFIALRLSLVPKISLCLNDSTWQLCNEVNNGNNRIMKLAGWWHGWSLAQKLNVYFFYTFSFCNRFKIIFWYSFYISLLFSFQKA